MREYFTPQRSVFPSYLTVESGRIWNISATVHGRFDTMGHNKSFIWCNIWYIKIIQILTEWNSCSVVNPITRSEVTPWAGMKALSKGRTACLLIKISCLIGQLSTLHLTPLTFDIDTLLYNTNIMLRKTLKIIWPIALNSNNVRVGLASISSPTYTVARAFWNK